MAAFSPVLLERFQQWRNLPFAASLLLAPLLLLRAARLDRRPAASPQPWAGLILLVLALTALLTGLRVQSTALAWAGLPVAIVGVAAIRGRPRLDTAVLCAWLVPIPTGLYLATTPGLESTQLRLAVAAVAWTGAPLAFEGTRVTGAAGSLYADPSDAGQHLVWLLAAIGWYAVVRARGRAGPAMARLRAGLLLMLASPLLALPMQTLALVLAVGLLAVGWPQAAAAWLHSGLWLVVAAAGFAWAECGRPAASPRYP